jgi:hypothetical protein
VRQSTPAYPAVSRAARADEVPLGRFFEAFSDDFGDAGARTPLGHSQRARLDSSTFSVAKHQHCFDLSAAGGLPEFGEFRPLTRGSADMVDALVVVL